MDFVKVRRKVTDSPLRCVNMQIRYQDSYLSTFNSTVFVVQNKAYKERFNPSLRLLICCKPPWTYGKHEYRPDLFTELDSIEPGEEPHQQYVQQAPSQQNCPIPPSITMIIVQRGGIIISYAVSTVGTVGCCVGVGQVPRICREETCSILGASCVLRRIKKSEIRFSTMCNDAM